MPYLHLYLDNIDTTSNDVSVLYWNRDLRDENTSAYSGIQFHEFKCYQEDEVAKIKKIRSFLLYRHFAKQVLKNEKFDKLIILHSLPGILLLDILKKDYSGRYILDYRDSTFEKYYLFRQALGSLIKHSIITLTSSDAFRKYFPDRFEERIYTTHNILKDSLDHRDYKKEPSSKIRVAFWGQIRHEEVNKAIIDRLANDFRFELHYYGREQNIAKALKAHVYDIYATNVFFHGEYVSTDRYEFARVTDIIHNIYYDNNTMLAMGNKYYDGLIFRIPQVCMPASFMGELCEKYNVGITLSPFEPDFANRLYIYASTLDKHLFNQNADNALRDVVEEYKKSVAAIKNALK